MPYEKRDGMTYRLEDDGSRTMLANFTAEIIEETRYIDGDKTETTLTITGENAKRKFERVEIEAGKFAALGWVMTSWGSAAVIQPGGSIKEDLRTAIQIMSDPKQLQVYTHTGWSELNGKRIYLHAKGGITAKGNNPSITVDLPNDLAKYDLTPVGDPAQCSNALIQLTEVAPPEVTWPILAATLSPLHGPTDFALHLTGRTGTFKSELLSLFQSAYGAQMDARHLPGSWSSTANALEALTYRAKNAPFVLDDFVPTGTSWQVRTYQKTADQIVRAQGNQSGRARLTDASRLQETMYPRGIILSTGEDTPEGHSVRARMIIVELTPGDVDPAKLTIAQNRRAMYPTATAAYIQKLAANFDEPKFRKDAATIRNAHLDIGHTRTPAMLGHLIASVDHWIEFLTETNYISERKARSLRVESRDAILKAGRQQSSYLETADPCEIFTEAIRSMLAGHTCHLRTLNGGIPLKATQLGWTEENGSGELPTYKSHGKVLGWVDWTADSLFLDATNAYNDVRKHAGQVIGVTKQTMMKRLKDAGMLLRTDDLRQRNTVRITAEGHPRQVLHMCLSQILNDQEVPQDGQA